MPEQNTEQKLVKLHIGDIEIDSEWNDSKTAQLIYEALPLKATGNYWGNEIYFEIPVKTGPEPDAIDVVDPGAVAYWPAGNCLCIFWGPTPASQADECRAASEVNIVGKVLNSEVLSQLQARDVVVEKA